MDSIYNNMTRSEKQIAKYLKERDLWWEFEFPVFVYEENRRPRLYSPDFYIPKLGLFIEVCGSKDFDYEHREKVYKENGISVVFLHYYKRRMKWKFFLAERIKEIEQQRQVEAKKLTGFANET
ncbi:MAG: hypothetical protein JSV05_06055 [Candidatus Bathyarchaeota archaeon]|nr:MAG: hypothetical protein JSV05_06055 [Candidatus Bathyarchaeota archaeon]